jgi:hypothetical protein
MFGAEEVLLDRATSANVAKNAIDMVNNFRAYFRKYNQPIDENPAPGNKAGGITTLAEKSLGCVQKGGDAPVAQVLRYGEARRSGWAASASSTRRQRRRVVDGDGGGGARTSCCSRPGAGRRSGSVADDQDQHQQRPGGEEAELDRL